MPNAGQNGFTLGNTKDAYGSLSYAAVLGRLQTLSHGVQSFAYASLPSVQSNPYAADTLWLSRAQQEVLGFNPSGGIAGYDGVVGIVSNEESQAGGDTADWTQSVPVNNTQYYMIGAIEKELSEVMGRTAFAGTNGVNNAPSYTLTDLFRYGGAIGTLNTNPSDSRAYFSIDKGANDTEALYFSDSGDLGDWAPNGPNDFFPTGNDAFLDRPQAGAVNEISVTDKTLMNVLGWDVLPPPPDNFTGDGMSDVLFQSSGGAISDWLMDASQITASNSLGDPGSNWHVVGTGDITGAGPLTWVDLYTQSDSGQIWDWQVMNGNLVGNSHSVGNPGSSWHAVGTGDFNGDGNADILMQNDSGQVWEWQMNSNLITSSASVGNPGSSWHVVGTGDFNGDGRSDILMQNDSGQIWEWQMNGFSITSSASVGNPGASWHVVGTGDFTGDGKSDILLQNDSGQVWEWQMDGSQITSSASVGNPGASWHVVKTGYYNGDGNSDILFQNASGQVWQWLMSGNQITASASLGNPGSSWHVA
jgi:hypothetical protein